MGPYLSSDKTKLIHDVTSSFHSHILSNSLHVDEFRKVLLLFCNNPSLLLPSETIPYLGDGLSPAPTAVIAQYSAENGLLSRVGGNKSLVSRVWKDYYQSVKLVWRVTESDGFWERLTVDIIRLFAGINITSVRSQSEPLGFKYSDPVTTWYWITEFNRDASIADDRVLNIAGPTA